MDQRIERQTATVRLGKTGMESFWPRTQLCAHAAHGSSQEISWNPCGLLACSCGYRNRAPLSYLARYQEWRTILDFGRQFTHAPHARSPWRNPLQDLSHL